MSTADYQARHRQYLIKKNSRPGKVAALVDRRMASAKRGAATLKARNLEPSQKQKDQRERYAAAIDLAKANGAQPGGIKKAALKIMRGGKGGAGSPPPKPGYTKPSGAYVLPDIPARKRRK